MKEGETGEEGIDGTEPDDGASGSVFNADGGKMTISSDGPNNASRVF